MGGHRKKNANWGNDRARRITPHGREPPGHHRPAAPHTLPAYAAKQQQMCVADHQHSSAWDAGLTHSFMDYSVVIASSLALVLYLNTLPADFAYDDSRAIVKNPDLHSDASWGQLFFNDFWGTPLTHSGSHKSYRPLCVLTFRLNHLVGGLSPWGYHLGNVLLHTLATAVFTDTARLLLGYDRWPALVAGVMFASHPIHTEAVAGVVGRADIMACLFFLLAFRSYIAYCRYRDDVYNVSNKTIKKYDSHNSNTSVTKNGAARNGIVSSSHVPQNSTVADVGHGIDEKMVRWVYVVAMATFTACAMLSKEQGVTVLAVCAVYDVFLHCALCSTDLFRFHKWRRKGFHEGLSCLVTVGALLVGVRLYLMGSKVPEFAPADNPASDHESALVRSLTFLYLPFLHFWLLLYPKVLSFDWSMGAVPLIEDLTDLRNLCTLTFYSILLYIIVYLFWNLNSIVVSENKESNKPVANGGKAYTNCNGNGHIGGAIHGNHSSVSYGSSSNNLHLRHSSGSDRRGSDSSSDSSHSNTNLDDTPPYYAVANGRHVSMATTSPSSSSAGYHLSSYYPTTENSSMRMLVISLSIIIFPFIPASNLFFYVGFVVAERVLYLPSMGFCLLVAEGVRVLCRSSRRPIRPMVLAAILCLIVAYSARTVDRNFDWRTEEDLYRAGIPVNPAKAWGNLANILNNQGRHVQAEEAYRNALRYRANMADVHYNLGILLQEQQRYQEAVDSYHMAIKCRPRLTMAHLNLGIVYSTLGRRDESEKMYRHCADIDISGLKDPRLHENTKISALYNLGRLMADQDRYQEAISVYEEAIRRRPAHYAPQSLYNMLGEAFIKLGDADKAKHWYQQALAAKPDHIPAHLTMAKLYQRMRDISEAEKWFLKAQKIDSKDCSVYQHYAQFLGEVGRHDNAAENYMKAAQLSPHDFELTFNTANSLRQAGQNDGAEEYYRRAVALKPDEPTAHMNLGAMLHLNRRLADAEQSYQMALKLRPDDTITQTNLRKLRNLMAKAQDAKGAGPPR